MPYTALRDFHLYLNTPTAIFKARVNMPGTITYPVTELTFDGVTLGAFGDIPPDATLILGTTDGADDLGRVRVQNVATSSTIPVGRVSQGTEDGTLSVTDNAYITVWNEYRVWAKIPYSTGTIDYKDSNIEVGTYNEDLPPVANCGPGFADYIDDDDIITVTFDGTGSYAMADGATITDYAWDLQGGTVTAGDLDEDTLTATFEAGFRWVSLTVTDSNGRPHTSRCPVLAVDPANDPTIKFQVPSHRIEMRGQSLGFEIFDNLLRSTFPDGGLVMFWADEPIDPTDRDFMAFIGWHQSDSFSIRATPTGNIRTTVLNCVDVAGRLAALPGFPQALQREPELDSEGDPIDIMWALMPTLDMRKCLWYLAFWHSTALSLADFLLPDSLSDYPAMRLDSTGASLYEQINSRAQSCVPDHWLTCNIQGQLAVLPDWMLLDPADRPVDTAGTLTEDYWKDTDATYQRPPKFFVLNSSAVVCSTDWLELGGEDTLPLAFCKAPGLAYGQGVSEATTGEKLTISQEELNHCEGHRYARLNARYGLFTIVEPTGDIQAFQPAHMLPVQLNISAATAAQRGLDFTTARGLVKSIDMRYNHTEHGTWVSPTLQWEREVTGFPAVTHVPEEAEDPDYEVPEPPPVTIPPDFGLIDGQEMVAGIGIDGYVYRTSDFQTDSGSGGPTWDRVDTTIADTIYSFVVDPFSPGYIGGVGAINGWIANDTDIYRVTDLFGSVAASSVHTFATATSGAAFHWRSIQASFGAYFAEGVNPWLLCVSYYGDTVGHTGTWATRSTDGGATWAAEVQVSADYDEGAQTRFNPIGVYTSPKTPGLAYTVAHIETTSPARTDGRVATDWGATWARVSADPVDDPAAPLPGWEREDDGGATTPLPGGGSGTYYRELVAVGSGSAISETEHLNLIAPPNAVRVVVFVRWMAHRERTAVGSSASVTIGASGTVGHTGSINFTVLSGYPDTNTGSGELEYTWSGPGDWPANGIVFNFIMGAQGAGASESGTGIAQLVASIIEIELDDNTTYTPPVAGPGAIQPGHLQAGTLHLPWNDNSDESLIYFGYADLTATRAFKLKRASGTTITDISPNDGSIDYGVNKFTFAIRAHDDDRQFIVASVIGNDTSQDAADDFHGVYISVDGGDNWTEVIAPIADSGTFSNRPAFEAAFGGGVGGEDILFIWGPPEYIGYSDDQGGTVDDRSGNLDSFSPSGWIGIAGGPSA